MVAETRLYNDDIFLRKSDVHLKSLAHKYYMGKGKNSLERRVIYLHGLGVIDSFPSITFKKCSVMSIDIR